MITISILDDEKVLCEILYQLIKDYTNENSIQVTINKFSDPKEFLKYEEKSDLLFLDISMPEISGMDISKQLFEQKKETCIVFLTSHPEYIQEAFKVKAFRYIIKPVEKYELEEVLNDYFNHYPDNFCLFADKNKVNHLVKQNDIYYIESLGDTSAVYTVNKIYETNLTIRQWTDKLDFRYFFQTNPTYIINLNHIISFKDELILSNDTIIPISRRRKKYLYEAIKKLCS